ncbi:MAG: nitrous oxide reductase family maturation protein NosD [Cytophagales bacterium]|nr:nitrous oxide reductase family maturation protein NosD [Cytophagales bacterium]
MAGTIHLSHSSRISSLEKAVELAEASDTIQIKAGTYKSVNLELKKPLTIIGEAGVVLDGNNEGYILRILCNDVRLKGLKLINAGKSYTRDYAAIYISHSSNFHIDQIEIVDPFFGILIEKSSNGRVQHVKVFGTSKQEDDAGNGIHAWHCSNLNIHANEIQGMRDGIYLEFVDDSLIDKNKAVGNIRYGLHFMFSNHDRYHNNHFKNNGAGVAVMFSKFIEMRNNEFLENWGTSSYGLLLKEIYDAEVKDNLFYQNTTAVFIDGTTRLKYAGNTFKLNGWAIRVSGGCYENEITANNFISNSFDVSYNSRVNDNTVNGNFWSEYGGYDLDRDGVGDVPHRPVKLFSYIVNRTPETIVMMRSLFVDLINFSERITPVFTPDNLMDETPAMNPFP